MKHLETYEDNFQAIYFSGTQKEGIAMNVLRFGINYFMSTSLFHHRQFLNDKCPSISKTNPPKTAEFSDLIANSLLDSIRIVIAFENYFKAHLLLSGYIIHDLNKEVVPGLSKQQHSTPVTVAAVIREKPFEFKKTNNRETYRTSAINKGTLSISKLLKYAEGMEMGVSDTVLKKIREYADNRNTLHFLNSQQFTISSSSHKELEELISIINTEMIPRHNTLVSKFGIDPDKLLIPL